MEDRIAIFGKEPRDDWRQQLEEIFFLSAVKKDFASENEKKAFLDKWTGIYFKNFSNSIFLYIANDKVVSYLTAAYDSASLLEHFALSIPYYALFKDLFEDFPAHLHINTHPDYRGKNIGSILLGELKTDLVLHSVGGVHLVTSPSSANVKFYTRNGFDHQVERPFNGKPLLFMGQKLNCGA